jgi:peptidoglycan/xylan/chitin deacetylase (PgdA/CDA1 family)
VSTSSGLQAGAGRSAASFRDPVKEEFALKYPGSGVQRVMMPYRERRGKIKFPDNARLGVHVYVATEYALMKPVTMRGAKVRWDVSTLSAASEYSYRVGAWRVLEMLEKVGVKCTVLANGWPAPKYPELHREYHKLGHEIGVHNWVEDETNAMYTPEEEVKVMRMARQSLADVIGWQPVGYITQGDTDKTIALQIEEGYLWTASLREDDLPWIWRKGDKTTVEIPHRTATTGDWNSMGHPDRRVFHEGWQRSPDMAVDYAKRYIDAYLETADEQGWPMDMVFGIHPYVGSLPDRVRALERMLTYLKSQRGIWMHRYMDIAEYWKANYSNVGSATAAAP